MVLELKFAQPAKIKMPPRKSTRTATNAAKKTRDAAKKKRDELMLDYRIFRVIPPTDKAGKPIEESFIDEFEYSTGEFFFDHGTGSVRQRFVTTMEGEEGQVFSRRLQQVDSPWGIDDQLPILPAFTLSTDDTMPTLRREARKRDVKSTGSIKIPIFNEIKRFEDERTVYLPLKRVKRDVEKTNVSVGFLKGEIVHANGVIPRTGKTNVTDYEGSNGAIKIGDLRDIEKPFGLRIFKHGGPEEENTESDGDEDEDEDQEEGEDQDNGKKKPPPKKAPPSKPPPKKPKRKAEDDTDGDEIGESLPPAKKKKKFLSGADLKKGQKQTKK